MIDMYCIDWDAVSSITSVIMMGIALLTLWVTYQQHRDELRARLSFEIISWNGLFLLKITNVGKESAYNIKLTFSGEFLENHFSNEIKDEFAVISARTFTMTAGRDLHYLLTPIWKTRDSTFHIGKEEYGSKEINEWLDKNKKAKLHICGTYCNNYHVDEHLSIDDYIVGKSIVVEDAGTIALEQISKGLSCKNDLHHPIQERIDDIAMYIKKISNNNNG